MQLSHVPLMAMVLHVAAALSATGAEPVPEGTPLKLSLTPSKTAFVQREALCLNVVLAATRDVRVAKPQFSGHDKALQIYVARAGGEKRRLDWEDSCSFKRAVVLLKAGEELSDSLCIWWDLGKNSFPFAEAGRYVISAELQVQLANADGSMTHLRLAAPPIQVDVAQPPAGAGKAYDLMGKLGDLMASEKYGKPLREPLVKIVEECPDTPYARFAAWSLARTLAEGDQDAEGLQRMAGYLKLAVRDPLKDRITEDSLRLGVSVYNQLQQLDNARECARSYLHLFPNGQYVKDIREWEQRHMP